MDEIVFSGLSDEELQRLSLVGGAEGSQAENVLSVRYYRLVRRCARPYFLLGGDHEDLIQEGMIGLLSAIRGYQSDRGASFSTFAEHCVLHRIQSAVRAASAVKRAGQNNTVPLQDFLSDESQSPGTFFRAGLYARSPEEQVLARETAKEHIAACSDRLSPLERRVLSLYLTGQSYEEMAAATGRDVKAMDNAVQRIRRKLAQFTPGESSES